MNTGDNENSMAPLNPWHELYDALSRLREVIEPVAQRNLSPGLRSTYSLCWSRVYDAMTLNFERTSDGVQRASDGTSVIPAAVTNDPVWREVTSDGQGPAMATGGGRSGPRPRGEGGEANPASDWAAQGGSDQFMEQPAREPAAYSRREGDRDIARQRAAQQERARRQQVHLMKQSRRKTWRRRR